MFFLSPLNIPYNLTHTSLPNLCYVTLSLGSLSFCTMSFLLPNCFAYINPATSYPPHFYLPNLLHQHLLMYLSKHEHLSLLTPRLSFCQFPFVISLQTLPFPLFTAHLLCIAAHCSEFKSSSFKDSYLDSFSLPRISGSPIQLHSFSRLHYLPSSRLWILSVNVWILQNEIMFKLNVILFILVWINT